MLALCQAGREIGSWHSMAKKVEQHKAAEPDLERGWKDNYAGPEHQALCAMPPKVSAISSNCVMVSGDRDANSIT